MSKLFFQLINNRRGTGSSKKPASVEIRFSLNRERKYFSTGVMVCPNNWSDKTHRAVRCKDADSINETLDLWLEKAKSIADKFITDDSLTLDNVKGLMEGEDSKKMDFATYCEKRAECRNVRPSTKGRYMVFVRFLRGYGKIISFSDAANESKVRGMDEFLHKKGYKQSTIYDYHKFMKLFINDACTDGLIEKNPYDNLSFKVSRGEKKYVDNITEEQFNKLKELKLTSPHLQRVRDLFLFQCYTAMAYSDLMSFDYSNCEKIDGKVFYHSKRTKTDVDFAFMLLDPAVEILKKYDYKLPTITNQKYNDYLKAIGAMIGVEKMHSHMGRGTAATLFLSKGMSINIVARTLGHTNLRQTMRYARTLNKDVVGAFDKLEGKL